MSAKNKLARMAALVTAFVCLGVAMPLTANALTVPTPTASYGTYTSYIKVTWSSVSGATKGYYIKRSTSSNYSSATTIATASKSSCTYYDSSAVAGRVYYYWVCPHDGETSYYNTSKYAQGLRATSKQSYSITGSTSVNIGSLITLTFSGPTATWRTSSSCGALTQTSGKNVILRGMSLGTVTVYATYNGTTYSKTITVTAASGGGGGGSAYISGSTSLRYLGSANYYLYVGGKKVTANSVAWTCSGRATMSDKGYYGLLKATIRPATSTEKVKAIAKYSGRSYSKQVTISR